MRRVLFVILLAVSGCQHPAHPRGDAVHPAAATDAAVATVVDGTTLPPPSEELGDVPADAAHVALVEVAHGLDRPVLATFAPGDPKRRLFVIEQHVARVRTIENGQLADAPFLDLHGKVSTDNEQGLLGLAFHPRFADDHRVFVYFTDRKGDSHVVEYTLASADDAKVDVKTARELFFTKQPFSNHNGGNLAFGPDGKLYLGLGDGGSAADPHRNGQNPDVPLGKLLRIDVDAAQPAAAVVAIGLRNPWRFDFDPSTGDLYIGDVGQETWEEVDVVPFASVDGANFGWSVAEGRHCFRDEDCDLSKYVAPVTEYHHDPGCSVTGGVVYRGAAMPALDGVYFYGDYCAGWIHSFRWAKDGIRAHWDWRPVLDPDAQVAQLSSFGRDIDGEIYALSLDGTVWKLAPK
jgi:glucose/arabinose dehydrogenase